MKELFEYTMDYVRKCYNVDMLLKYLLSLVFGLLETISMDPIWNHLLNILYVGLSWE